MASRKLTGFGKAIIALLLVVPGAIVAEMAFSSYHTKEKVTKALEITNPFSTGFRLTNKTHLASILVSRGEFDVNYENRCNGEFEQIAKVSYAIKHVPFSKDQIEFTATPSRSVSSRVYFDTPQDEVFLIRGSGSIDSLGDIDTSFESAPVKWVNGESGDFYNLAKFQGTYNAQGRPDRNIVAVSREVIASTDAGEKAAQVFTVNAKINKSNAASFTFGVSAEKVKSQTFFAKSTSIVISSEVEDNSVSIKSSLTSELISYQGNPLERIAIDSLLNINDTDSFRKLSAIINSTCQGRFVDEESRVELRLLATKIVDGGISLNIQPIAWTGPRGDFNGAFTATVKKVIDQNTGLPDFKRGISINSTLTANSLYQKADFLSELSNSGFIKENNGFIEMNVIHEDLVTQINDRKVSVSHFDKNDIVKSFAFVDQYMNMILGVR